MPRSRSSAWTPANIGSLDRATLTTILLHHVTAGRKDAAAVIDADSLRMLDRTRADVEVTDAGVFVDGAKVIAPNVSASNGIIHVVDAVLLP